MELYQSREAFPRDSTQLASFSNSISTLTMKSEQEPEAIGTNEYYENIPRKRFFLGCQGKKLTTQVAIAGSIGFLLFGYDQGVLGVS
jgi:hypothetical protein